MCLRADVDVTIITSLRNVRYDRGRSIRERKEHNELKAVQKFHRETNLDLKVGVAIKGNAFRNKRRSGFHETAKYPSTINNSARF